MSINKLEDSKALLKKEKTMSDFISNKVGQSIRLRDLAQDPHKIGTWHHYLSDTASLFSTIESYKNGADISITWVVMDNLGFGIMERKGSYFHKNYLLGLPEASDNTLIYDPPADGHLFSYVTNLKNHINSEYFMREYEKEKDIFLQPILEEIYFKNIRDIKL